MRTLSLPARTRRSRTRPMFPSLSRCPRRSCSDRRDRLVNAALRGPPALLVLRVLAVLRGCSALRGSPVSTVLTGCPAATGLMDSRGRPVPLVRLVLTARQVCRDRPVSRGLLVLSALRVLLVPPARPALMGGRLRP